jgi:carboxyl-terminal processing protease
VGERTYGDASVRKTITLEDGSAVILSVAKYYSPAGKAIQDTGVTPSVPVVEADATAMDDDGNPVAVEPQHPAEDLLLKKAIEVITKGRSDVASAPAVEAPGAPPNKGGSPILTPLNVPHPQQQPR